VACEGGLGVSPEFAFLFSIKKLGQDAQATSNPDRCFVSFVTFVVNYLVCRG
jgi:hypothetical protein